MRYTEERRGFATAGKRPVTNTVNVQILLIALLTFSLLTIPATILPCTLVADDDGGENNEPEQLDLNWRKEIPGQVMDVAVEDDFVYMACNESGLQIVRSSTQEIVGGYDTPGLSYGIDVRNSMVYLADLDGLVILQHGSGDTITKVGELNVSGQSFKVKVLGNYAYVCELGAGLSIVDISNPADPVEIGRFDQGIDHVTDCDVVGDTVYVVDWWGLRIVDVRDRTDPQEIGNLSTPGFSYGLDVVGDIAYVADDYKGLRIMDISDPVNITEVGYFIPDDSTLHIQVKDGFAYLANLESGILVLDVTETDNIEETSRFEISGQTRRVHLYGNSVYAVNGDEGVTSVREYQPPDEPPDDPNLLLFFVVVPIVAIFLLVKKRYVDSRGKSEHNGTDETRGPEAVTKDQEGPTQRNEIGERTLLGGYMISRRIIPGIEDRTIAQLRAAMEHDVMILLEPEDRFRLYLTMKQLSYITHPDSEWLRDLFHNHREDLKFESYYEIPLSPHGLLDRWGLPRGLKGKIHLDAAREEILETIKGSSARTNFVIIGEPGVGKTALLYQVFESLSGYSNCAVITSSEIGNYHARDDFRIFIDDLPEEQGLCNSILWNNPTGLVVTAREREWEALPYDLQRMFTRLTIRRFTADELVKLTENLLGLSSKHAGKEAIELLVDYAEGSPIFVWTMLEQLRRTGQRTMTSTFIRENASRGMLSYIGEILVRMLKEKGSSDYRNGGFHGLVMLYFLAAHMEGRRCSTILFNRISRIISDRMTDESGPARGLDPDEPGLVLSILEIQHDLIRFPHDYWADLVLGKGERNPFAKDLILIREQLSDSGIFEQSKRHAILGSWKQIHDRYLNNPASTRTAFLSFCENILSNFTIQDLKENGVDIEAIRQIAALYSHLPEGESILRRIERIEPLPTQKIIQITDSVILRSTIG